MKKHKGRRRTQIVYYVQDWSNEPLLLWWSHGKWVLDYGEHAASSMKTCKNIKIALKHVRKLQSLGASPLLSRRVLRKKQKWEDFTFKEKL